MSVHLHRREFTQCALAAGAALLGQGGNWAVAAAPGDDWAVPLLGDLHVDSLDHHDLDWLNKEHPDDLSQVQSYSRITRESTPKLLDAVRQRAAAHGGTVPFMIQLGDLLEGLCGSEALARKQAADALDLLQRAKLSAPLLMTKGNHDVTGPGAVEVYNKVLVPFMAGQAISEIKQPAFAHERGGVLFVFYDAYDRASLDWFEQVLKDRQPKRLIFVIHPPVVPYNARSTWHIYSQPHQQPQRQRLLELLGRARAIVLSGHLHKYSFLVRRTESGRFVQLALSSVAKNADAKPADLIEDVAGYGPDLVNLEPRHSPDKIDARRQVLAAERPLIERFKYADTWGHALLTVRGDRIQAAIHRGFDQSAWKNLELTDVLDDRI